MLQLKHDKIVFINVGRLQLQKNQTLLVEAFSKVHKQMPNTELIIIGEGELRGKLENLVEKYELQHCVDLPGQCNDVQKRLNAGRYICSII